MSRVNLRVACTRWLDSDPSSATFAAIVQDAIDLGVSQRDLATHFEVAESTIMRWRKHQRRPHPLLQKQVIQRILALLTLLGLLAGCAVEGDSPLTAVGRYELASTWADGTCGFTGVVTRKYEITPTGTFATPEVVSSIAGTVACDTQCEIEIGQEFNNRIEYSGLWLVLTLQPDHHVTGTGDVTVIDLLTNESCAQSMTLNGVHTPFEEI